MLLTFANVERRLDPAQAKSQLQPSSALALLWLYSFCGPLGSDCPSLTSLPCLPCLSVRRGVGQSSVRSSLLKPCALQMLLMLLLLLLSLFFALVALVFFLQLSVLFDCRTRRTQTRIPAVAPAPAPTPAATALPARSGADYLHAAIIFASVCMCFSPVPALAWPGLAYCLMNDCSCQSGPVSVASTCDLCVH